MAGDFSRKIFNPKKHYSGVLMQQGRVQLDADWNEQLDIQSYRTRTETKDVIGACGVPKKGASFQITVSAANGTELHIAPGRIYVGGLLCELEEETNTTYFHQPYYPAPNKSYFEEHAGSPPNSPPSSPPSSPAMQLKEGTYIAYIEAWQREISYLDDPLIQEVALGEADTTTRLQTVWQVKLLQPADATITCKGDDEVWTSLTALPTGTLNVQTIQVNDPEDPCVLPPTAGYKRLENQLYRVEVQQGGNLANTTFKWSRDNASVVTTIEQIEGSIVTVSETGKDEILGFATGQWVEMVDETATLQSSPYPLAQIMAVDHNRREITLDTTITPNANGGNIKLRRWDQSAGAGVNGVPATNGWIDLEDGIQVQFSEGTYHSGDYWLIPARTATGEVEWPPYDIPNLSPVAQLPAGIQHYYCRLAIIKVEAGKTTVQDCRPLFPTLTDICAEDICFDNKQCDFLQADNVQEALDLLCAANDLRKHHKYLHGFGVICGLKVACSPTRTGVVIENGAALDCEGNIIEVKTGTGLVYNIVEEAKKLDFLNDGNGTVCLSITGGPNRTAIITIEKYEPKSFWDTVLEGTLLKDFFEDCILDLINFFKDQLLSSLTETAPVPLSQRRLTAFLNLFAQKINSASGPYAFISGNKEGGRITEDELLHNFYEDLKNEISSQTFCAMFDNDRPFPGYDIDKGLETIFGPAFKFHHKLRLHPSGNIAYTCGKNNNIYVYDLEKRELIQVAPFPGDTSLVVQDIAISQRDGVLYAAALLNNKDTIFAVAKITPSGALTWIGTSVEQDKNFVSLAAGPDNQLYGVAKSLGFYIINAVASSAFAVQQLREFKATGLLTISKEGLAIAADQATGTDAAVFNQLQIFFANNGSEARTIALSGNDLLNDVITTGSLIFATGNSPASGQRIVCGFNIGSGNPQTNSLPVDDTSALRLATFVHQTGNYLLMALTDKCKVERIKVNDFKQLDADPNFRIPVQLFPIGIAITPNMDRGYVLNMLSNTLIAIDLPVVFNPGFAPEYTAEPLQSPPPPPYRLTVYRDNAIAAYEDLLSHLLQYLKDCFCDKFLVNCPECDEDDKVYLGCADIKNFQVYHICNFSKRKYVKSFRTVEYWLSTIPVLPIFKEAFTKFCCLVLDKKRTDKTTVDKS